VTGNSINLGRKITLESSRHRFTIICVDVNREGNDRTAQDEVKLGDKCREYICDVTNSKALDDLAKKAGPVDVLVKNSGILHHALRSIVRDVGGLDYSYYCRCHRKLSGGCITATISFVMPVCVRLSIHME